VDLEGILVAAVTWSFSVTPLYAEVMDKEPTVAGNWIVALAGGAAATIAWRWRWWFGAAVSAVALALVHNMYLEITDPSVGPAIREEAGQS
jgi:hypothetical protein